VIKLKVNLYDTDGEIKGEMSLPAVFDTQLRQDLIRKAFRAITLSLRQPYGSYPLAGMRRVGQNAGPGHGTARIPRTSGSSRAVLLASFVGGKSAHSPRTAKVLFKGINSKERKLARMSAIAMTASREYVRKRGHVVSEEVTLPVVVKNEIENIKKTKDAAETLKNLGLYDDVIRAKGGIKIRAGRGKMRGRTYREPKSILIVGSSKEKLRAFSTLPGVEVVSTHGLSIRKLAPGGDGGRLTLFTESAIKTLEEME
jgi:large subunit ribosomal protein L4e